MLTCIRENFVLLKILWKEVYLYLLYFVGKVGPCSSFQSENNERDINWQYRIVMTVAVSVAFSFKNRTGFLCLKGRKTKVWLSVLEVGCFMIVVILVFGYVHTFDLFLPISLFVKLSLCQFGSSCWNYANQIPTIFFKCVIYPEAKLNLCHFRSWSWSSWWPYDNNQIIVGNFFIHRNNLIALP